jgi:tetratricopeptide (TPR) repeat protein
MGNYQEAVRPLEQVMISGGYAREEAEAAYWAGFCYLKLGKYDLAERRFQQAVHDLVESHLVGTAYVGLGDSLQAQGKRDKAREYYRRALDDHSTFIDVPRVEERLGLRPGGASSPTSSVPASDPAVSPTLPKGSFSVQVGAFETREAAMGLVERVKRSGHAPHIYDMRREGKQLYAVRVGIYQSKKEAEDVQRRLKAAGFDAFVVQ